mgnify:CR=1 FL=1
MSPQSERKSGFLKGLSSEKCDYRPSWRVQRVPVLNAGNQGHPAAAPVLVSTDVWAFASSPGERVHDLFDQRCKILASDAAKHSAIDYGDVTISFDELKERANRLARFLASKGLGPGKCFALLFDRSIDSYAAVLAASKLGAAYVPLDASFPPDRIRFMLEDSGADIAVTQRSFVGRFAESSAVVIALDDFENEIEAQSAASYAPAAAEETDPLAYIIYTSGSTGKPKGVPIRQSSICNFLHVAAKLYGFSPQDRVYQGLTIAFDFSVEEIWVPLISGSTLVPAPSQSKLAGSDLGDFLAERHVTALCCVPTLLATLEPRLPLLRFLLVSGEACPSDVIAKWYSPGRRILNAYGPTETTVTATWNLVEPGRPVTIGGPLPTYTIIIIDPETGCALEPGEAGEICISGIGLCDDYLNRPDQTQRAFMTDFIGLKDNPSGRIYRTGDLGRINAQSEIEFLGRIDTQVKIRGYRIELDEIEAVARAVEGIGQAVVQPYDPDGTGQVLAAYLTPVQNGTRIDFAKVDAALKAALPAYMVPSYYDQLESIPMLPSNKADRKALPPPSSQRFVVSGAAMVEPRNAREAELALLLADVLKLERVSVEADFFDDLGADSLKLASYVTAIRKQLGIRRITMRQLYEHSSITALAAVLERAAAGAPAPIAEPVDIAAKAVPSSEGNPNVTDPARQPAVSSPAEMAMHATAAPKANRPRAWQRHAAAPHVPSRTAIVATAAAQTLVYAATLFIAAAASVVSYSWIADASGLFELYLRAAFATSSIFFGGSGLLITMKWLAIGRFTESPIPIYSTQYVRFWIARQAIQANPLNLLAGTPLYNVYLRLLGMNIGENALILARPPVCTDLVSVGAWTVVRHDAVFPGYTAHQGYLYPGRIAIGSNTLVCEAVVLDIDTSIGDGSQIGTTSALLEGQCVPASAVYQGSPAEPSAANFNRVAPVAVTALRPVLYSIVQLSGICLFSLPCAVLSSFLAVKFGLDSSGFSAGSGVATAVAGLAVSAAFIYFGGLILAMIATVVVPRVLNQFVIPEKPHPLYGVQYQLARSINRLSNNKILNTLFGDSSMILPWLSAVGYDLTQSTQTGSNFGVDQRHNSPFLSAFNRNTLVSDGLLMMNMEVSSTSFVLRQVTMPPDTYVGNVVHYPADARMGANCLIATKAAIPIEGPIRTGVGLLGSPVFEIPRSVARDQRFDHYKQPGVLEERLKLKLRSNLVTLGLYIVRSWGIALMALVLAATAIHVSAGEASDVSSLAVAAAFASASLAFVVLAALFSILCERLVCGSEPLQPRYCSLYDPLFWAHERFWKLNYNAFLRVFDGTPFKPLFLRLQGARVGSRVFDDGAGLTEPSMVTIGDECMLNYRCAVQSHSLEDGTFKSDRISIGNRCTIGTGGFVHYGSTMQDASVLEADAFLMKGSLMESGTRWLGNPARDAASADDVRLAVAKGGKKW